MMLRRGASGDAVSRVQARLRELGFYLGPVDGIFGGGTESAIKSYQKSVGIGIDGTVGDVTWSRLFPSEPAPESVMLKQPVALRCLALTGCFETSTSPPECFCGVTGDFDGQGISYGALQWNVGQGSLQPLLKRMIEKHRDVCENVFHEHLPVIEAVLEAPRSEQLSFVRSLQDHRANVIEPWRGMLRTIGRTAELQSIQTEQAASLYDRATKLAADYELTTERGVALMFDIIVQNGSISNVVRAQIMTDYAEVAEPPGPAREVARMKIIANRRSAAAKPKFVNDVRSRKMTIAEGNGIVHGIPYDLEEQFGLRLAPFSTAGAARV